MKSALSSESSATMIFNRSSLWSRGLRTANLKQFIMYILRPLSLLGMGVGLSYVASKQMAGDDEADDRDEGCDKQLPRPQVVLEEECNEGQDGSNETATTLRTEAQYDASDEAPHADQQSLEGAIADWKDTGEPH